MFIVAPFAITQSISRDEYNIDYNAEMSLNQINVQWINGEDWQKTCTQGSDRPLYHMMRRGQLPIGNKLCRKKWARSSLTVVSPWKSTTRSDTPPGSRQSMGKEPDGGKTNSWHQGLNCFLIKQIVLLFVSASPSYVWRYYKAPIERTHNCIW